MCDFISFVSNSSYHVLVATKRRIEATQERLRKEFIEQQRLDAQYRDTHADDQAKVAYRVADRVHIYMM